MAPEQHCKATKENGEPCGAPAQFVDPDSGLCPSHDPDSRERIREAARKGGEAMAEKHSRDGLEEDELPPLDSPQAAEEWLETIARAVATGRLSSSEGNAIRGNVRDWLKAREAGEQAERIERLEKLLKAAREGRLDEVEVEL